MRRSMTVEVPNPAEFGQDNDRFMAKCDAAVKEALPAGSKVQSMNINTVTTFVAEVVFDDGVPAVVPQSEQPPETEHERQSASEGTASDGVRVERHTQSGEPGADG